MIVTNQGGGCGLNPEKLQDNLTDSLLADHNLVLLVGPPGCGKSRKLRELPGVGIINVGKEVARELMPVPREERAGKVPEILKDLVESHAQSVVALDNIELLLLPELELDLWSNLDTLSLSKKLIVAWTGRVDGDKIEWGDPGVPGHLVLSLENYTAGIVSITD